MTRPILSINHSLGETQTHAGKHKQRPFPPERIESNAEGEPPEQLEVGEEIKGLGGRVALYEARHVDPPLHPEGAWACEWV